MGILVRSLVVAATFLAGSGSVQSEPSKRIVGDWQAHQTFIETLKDKFFLTRDANVKPHPVKSVPAPVTDADYYQRNARKEALGKFLFFDKELSGNRNISCATCHHPFAFVGDGLSLPVGEGGAGTGVARDTGGGPDVIHERVPRNSPHVFNVGAREFQTMFHDGRVAVDSTQGSGFLSPAGPNLPEGLENVLAAQAMFPVTSATEMAGQAGENSIADATAQGNLAGIGGVWEQLADRLSAIPEYVDLFVAAFENVAGAEDISYVHAANAIAAFEAAAWRADNSPFDRFLRGNDNSLSGDQLSGMDLFYGKAGCASCHSGPFQTDHSFHAIGVPQIGPGKGDNLPGYIDGLDDFGRERVSADIADRFKFRTPSLRNVALTGPWGHDGAYNTLEAMVRHHLNARKSIRQYDPGQVVLPYRRDLSALDFAATADPVTVAAIIQRIEILPVSLSDEEVRQLMAFLHSLTDTASLDLRGDVPTRLPSGLPVFD